VATPVPNTTPVLGPDIAALDSPSADLQVLLGPPPLIYGEDHGCLRRILRACSDFGATQGHLRGDLGQGSCRLGLVGAASSPSEGQSAGCKNARSITAVMRPIIGGDNARNLAGGWALRDPEYVERLQTELRESELTMDAVMAQALQIALNDIERIDGMIMKAEARRNAALREIERHRAALADALRRATERVRDAEFKEVGCDQAPA
jgi:hypothetical protein